MKTVIFNVETDKQELPGVAYGVFGIKDGEVEVLGISKTANAGVNTVANTVLDMCQAAAKADALIAFGLILHWQTLAEYLRQNARAEAADALGAAVKRNGMCALELSQGYCRLERWPKLNEVYNAFYDDECMPDNLLATAKVIAAIAAKRQPDLSAFPSWKFWLSDADYDDADHDDVKSTYSEKNQ
ncbi:hypothetical protein D6833_08805 [Candidatus Parcubacteria bacterium]|nr:MAG: hypothetical protein D6833_08805 [Candidatus Parcubacteria bacterium]